MVNARTGMGHRSHVGDHAIYTRLFEDPTAQEQIGPSGSSNIPIDRCEAKPIDDLEVPNDPSATTLVIFGNTPYGSQGPAAELARFVLR
jgi:hypothetical protein